jgi:hypothetical protein
MREIADVTGRGSDADWLRCMPGTFRGHCSPIAGSLLPLSGFIATNCAGSPDNRWAVWWVAFWGAGLRPAPTSSLERSELGAFRQKFGPVIFGAAYKDDDLVCCVEGGTIGTVLPPLRLTGRCSVGGKSRTSGSTIYALAETISGALQKVKRTLGYWFMAERGGFEPPVEI